MITRSSVLFAQATRFASRSRLASWQEGSSTIPSVASASSLKLAFSTGTGPRLTAEAQEEVARPSQDLPDHAIRGSEKSSEDFMDVIKAKTIRILGEDDQSLLLQNLEMLISHGWRLDDTNSGIEKTFKFKSWMKCVGFAARIGLETRKANHHPTIVLRYGEVWVKWTTHKPRGLSGKDILMATCCDELAEIAQTSKASIEFNE